MEIKLINYTPLEVCDLAVAKCWGTNCKTDEAMKERIYRVGVKKRHGSVLEHLNYSFDIDGISRACLQELARHRHASMSVKSTRYTLKELANEVPLHPGEYLDSADVHSTFNEARKIASKYVVFTSKHTTNFRILSNLSMLQEDIQSGTSNDITKYCLPEAYKTSLVWTINARSLQNFLSLRTDKSALWEIRDLANEIYAQLPEEHKYLFVDFVKEC